MTISCPNPACSEQGVAKDVAEIFQDDVRSGATVVTCGACGEPIPTSTIEE